MAEVEFLPYDEVTHKADYIDMLVEYCKWLDSQVLDHYGFHLFQSDIKETIDRLVPRFTAIKPPEGITLIMKVDGKTAGMARLDRIDENVGMIHNVYIYPEYRGKGYSIQMMDVLEEKARSYGYSFLRLDTGGFNAVVQSLYRKLGYVEVERFTDFDNLKNPVTRQYYLEKIYMEKEL